MLRQAPLWPLGFVQRGESPTPTSVRSKQDISLLRHRVVSMLAMASERSVEGQGDSPK
jgi:hypothetical protein